MLRRRTVLKLAAATAVLPSAPPATAAAEPGQRVATGGISAQQPARPAPPQLARGRRAAFLRFEPVRPQRVARAKLRFTVSAESGSDGGYWPFEVFGVDAHGWRAESLTWDTAPRHGGSWLELVDASSAPDADPRGRYEVDVTGHVARLVAAGEPVAFRLEGLPDPDWTLTLDAPELVLFERDPVPELAPNPGDVSAAGAGLWLRYARQPAVPRFTALAREPGGASVQAAVDELRDGLRALTGSTLPVHEPAVAVDGGILLGTPDTPAVRELLRASGRDEQVREAGPEGYLLRHVDHAGGRTLLLASAGEVGVLYGAFRLLRLLRTGRSTADLDLVDAPRIRYRLNHHWDNFPSLNSQDGWATVERGYAGRSPWQLDLPASDVLDRYREYGRLNASVGLNGAVLNNPNATTDWIEPAHLPRIAELADALRPYGMRIYLSLRFDSPMKLRQLDSADPFNPRVRDWWRRVTDRIYRHVPDFGGFLVKGDSEGEPGPLHYGRTHADGANMFAELLREHGGIVLWRAFVYGDALTDPDPDRAKQACELFRPQDGRFAENVVLQTKNGPWDFQPREPVHPLFGSMPSTSTGIELALSKEYTGHTTHANYPVAFFERVLGFDTRARGRPNTVADVVDGSTFGHTRTLALAVNNPGTDRNWTRMPLDQANWYGFGQLAWNPRGSARDLAADWARMALHADAPTSREVADWLVRTDEVYRQYAQPCGIPFTASEEYHFKNEPQAWETSANGAAPDGLGCDRTSTGSGYAQLYPRPIADRCEDLASTPEDLVLFLHHVRHDQVLPHTGETLAQSIYDSTFSGVDGVRELIDRWHGLRGRIDHPVWRAMRWMLRRQLGEAVNYRNVMNSYVRARSGIADRRGRDDALREPARAEVADQTVPPGHPVSGIACTAPATAYLLPADRAGAGRWEREDRLLLAADGHHGTRAEAATAHPVLAAPAQPGDYRLHVVNAQGFVSAPSRGVVRVAAP